MSYSQSSDKFFRLDINHRNFISKYPVNLHICAKRVGEIPALEDMVIQQSDYLRVWNNQLIFDESNMVLKIKALLREKSFLYEPARRLYHAFKKRTLAAGQYDIDKALKSFE